MKGLADFATSEASGNTLRLKVMNTDYVEEHGRPVIQVLGREADGTFHHFEVYGHEPSFFIHAAEHDQRVDNHYAVSRTETGYESLHGEPLVRVYTNLPKQVPEVRELFSKTWEADIWYTQVWLLDKGIKTGAEFDLSRAEESWNGELRFPDDAVTACDPPEVTPRVVTTDIEVASEVGRPEPSKPYHPVSTIVAHDSYDDEYIGWLFLNAPTHLRGDMEFAQMDAELDDLRTFHDESEMLADYSGWVEDKRPDILTGWYSNDFDYPYLIQRMRELNTWAHQGWSPLEQVYISEKWGDPVTKGVSMIDMLELYEKTRIHELPRKSLDYVAGIELDAEKIELPLSHTEMWKQQPIEFLRYNRRDVALVKRLEEEKSLIGLLERMRELTGCEFTDFSANIVMIGMLTLHKARDWGVRLPTAVKPDVDWFHGAVVLDSVAGVHKNVVYLDYSSLYPMMMLLCNTSPETVVGDEQDLAESEYTEEDCVWSYHDPRPENVKEGLEPIDERIYFVKDDVQPGLMSSMVDEMVELKYFYADDDTMYEAVKRVTNSIWGVSGDKDSFGRGWRLFDWRTAEAITLGGRKLLKFGSQRAVEYLHANGYPDAKIVVGDTDGFGISLPSAESREEAIYAAENAAKHVGQLLPEFVEETFGSTKDVHEIEVESYADRLFIQARKGEGRGGEGTKKKYAQHLTWKKGKEVDQVQIKGFGYVRSDRAQVFKDAQEFALKAILEEPESAKEKIFEYVEDAIKEITAGERDEDIGIPFGFQKALTKYGTSKRTPQPQYRGAKYANQYIYESNAITPGDKPMYYYIREGMTGSYRQTYKAQTKEDGTQVDAISVLDANDIPGGFAIDYEKMVNKTLRNALKRIFRTMGWDYDWDKAIERHLPAEHFREAGQLGLGDCM